MTGAMLALLAGEVHLWIGRLSSAGASHLHAYLSGAERERAARFRFPKDRETFVFAHGVLRDILGQYLNCPPGDLQFTVNPFGKLFLAQTAESRRLEFNISHSGSVVVVAVSAGRRIGADVEQIRPISDFTTIAESYFTPQEYAFICHYEQGEQEWAFLRCWTRKEAYIKAVGKGLSIALNSFHTLIPSGQPGLRVPGHPDTPDVPNWWLTDIDVPEGYLGAIAVETGTDRVLCFEWQPGSAR